MIKSIPLTFGSITLISYLAFAQTTSLTSYFSAIRQGKIEPLPSITQTQNEGKLLQNLEVYAQDSITIVRVKAFDLTNRIGQKSEDHNIRRQSVHLLIQGIKDKDSGISGANSKALQYFAKTDFSNNDKQLLLDLLLPPTFYLERVAKLVGYLELKESENLLMQLLQSDINYKIKWHIRLALARMDNQEALDHILGKLSQAPVNDNLVYSIVPDLVYTRNPQIFKYLEGIIMSDEKSCESADPDANQNILCGYRIIEYLSGAIEGFPIPVDEFGESEIDDYEETLTAVRQWFTGNEAYVIKKDSY